MSKGFKIALPKNKFRLFWYLSIGLFLLYIFLIGWYNTTTSNTASIFQIVPLVALPLIGIIFFLLYERKSKKRLLILIELIAVTVASVGLFMVIIDFIPTIKVASMQGVLSNSKEVLKSSTPVPTPTSNPDPIVNCLIHQDCGGGSKAMKSSECDKMVCCGTTKECGGGSKFITEAQCNNSTCCQIGNKWIFYTSSKKCDQDQESDNQQTSTTKTDTSYDCYFEGKTYRASSYEECKRGIAEIEEIRRLTSELNANSGSYGNFSYPDWVNDTSEGKQIMEDIQNIDTTIEPWIPPVLPTPTPTPTCYPYFIGGRQGVVCP